MNFFLRKKYHLLFEITVLVLLYLNLIQWSLSWLGWILFIAFLSSNGRLWEVVLKRIFGIREYNTITEFFSWFFSFILLGFISSIFVVYAHLTSTIIWSVYFIVSVLGWSSCYLSYRQNLKVHPQFIEKNNLVIFKNSSILVILYFILFALGFYGLVLFKSNGIFYSPWQVIGEMYLLIFFALMLISGIFLFGKYKIKAVLFIFVLQSILLHLYLPLSHEMPWGGDVWRHLAVERQLQNQEYVLPVLVGDEASWSEVFGVDIPDVFIIPQKYTYGHLWGTSVLLSETLQVDLLQINKWLIPIVWSLLVPLILFKIGLLLFKSRRRALWLVWLSFLPFPLQALGALTLPTGLGFVVFLFVLMLWLHYLRDGQKWQRNVVLFFSVLMLFGYALYFILIWLLIIFSHIAYHVIHNKKITNYKLQITNYSLFLLGIFILPLFELVSKISYIPQKIGWLYNLKQFVGQFSGYYYASSIRSHDILSGNILFNHTPNYAFIESIFNSWRWWLVPAMLLIWFFVKFGLLIDILRKKKDEMWNLLSWLFFVVAGGYVIGWFILGGDRLFIRRLDPVFAILIIIFFVYGFGIAVSRVKRKYFERVIVLIFIILFSWFTTFSHASGPDIRVVSRDEYRVAEYIWENSDHDENNYCVIGDTWILLALEGISAGKIVGGGFPIDYQFGQKERVELFEQMQLEPMLDLLEHSKDLTDAEKCWFVVTSNFGNRERADGIFEKSAEEIGSMLVWGEGLKKGGE